MRPTVAAPLLLASIALFDGTASAQAPRRDPTQPPPSYAAQPAAHPKEPLPAFKPEHLVMYDGKRYVMWRGRRHAVGDEIEGARIERIDETEVWVRTERGVRKLPLFAGIRKTEESKK